MKVVFTLHTTIEVPDAELFPPKEEVERQMIDFFKSEGMEAHELEVTNYGIHAEEGAEQE